MSSQGLTKAITADIKNNVDVIKNDIVETSQVNMINGESLDTYIYEHFLNRLDAVEYCENVLRHHLPESRKHLHENQTALVRAVCNPKLKQVAGMMSRQAGKCFAKGTKIMMYNHTIKNVEDIVIGDSLMTPSGKRTKVTSLGRGREKMYEIYSSSGSYTVNESHILSLINKSGDVLNIEVKDFLKRKDKKDYFGYRMSKDFGKRELYEIDILYKGNGNYYGFAIDSEDKLFLLGDYTVVHNTESIACFSGFLIDNFPQMRVGIFTPRLQQAEISVGRLSTFCQMNEDRLNNKIVKLTKDRVELSNGSFVSAESASDQSNIEGLTFDIICLDEAQKISDYTFSERLVPMGSGTNAKIIQIGTPKTRNHFYDAVEGKAHEKWTVIKRDWTQCAQSWALDAIYLPDPKTGIVRPYSKFIVEQAMPKILKQEMFPNNPEIWTDGNLELEDFKTQYMLEFIDGAGKYLDSAHIEKLTSGEYEWLEHGKIGEHYVAGIDFAGSNPDGDATHITVLRVNPDGVKQKVYCKEFKGTSYPEQMYFISNLFGGYSPKFEVRKIFADYTGCGAAVIQTLKEEFGLLNIEGIIFNARDRYTNSGMNMKNIMYGKWRQELENGKFQYLKKELFEKSTCPSAGVANVSFYHRMISEWADLEYTTGGSLNKKIEAPAGSGQHDDCCDADVLANFAVIVGQRGKMPRPSSARLSRW